MADERGRPGRPQGPLFGYEEVVDKINRLAGDSPRHVSNRAMADAAAISIPTLLHWRRWHGLSNIDPPWPLVCRCEHCQPRIEVMGSRRARLDPSRPEMRLDDAQRIVEVTDLWLRLFGYQAATQVVGRPSAQIVRRAAREAAGQGMPDREPLDDPDLSQVVFVDVAYLADRSPRRMRRDVWRATDGGFIVRFEMVPPTSGAIMHCGPEGVIFGASREYLAMFGYSRLQQVLGRHAGDIVGTPDGAFRARVAHLSHGDLFQVSFNEMIWPEHGQSRLVQVEVWRVSSMDSERFTVDSFLVRYTELPIPERFGKSSPPA